MEYFSYKGGCGVCKRMRIEAFKKELAWAIDKWLWLMTDTVLLKTVIPLRV